MCSRKCESPDSSGASCRAPTRTHTPTACELTHGISSPMTVMPDGSTALRNPDSTRMPPSPNGDGGRSLRAATSFYPVRTPLPPGRLRLPAPVATVAAVSAPAAPAPVVAVAAAPAVLPFRLRHVAGQRLLAAELDLSLAVDADHLHEDRVALVDDVLDALHPLRLQLRDVDEPVLARGDLHERAERHDAAHDPLVDAADLRILDDRADDLPGAVAVGAARGRDAHLAGVLDVDLRAGLGADLLDHLAAGADDLADLVGVDHHDVDARRVRREIRPRPVDRGVHLLEHEEPRLAGLVQRARHDVVGEALDLDVHLEGGHAVPRPRHLEVHVAEVVLDAEDVGEDGDVVPLL